MSKTVRSALKNKGRFRAWEYALMTAVLLGTMLVCVSVGSVALPLHETAQAVWNALCGHAADGVTATIILSVRLPRVLCVALVGASLSLSGAAMQGLLRNPLADGSTLGVASGASLGAVLALALGVTLPGLPLGGTAVMAMAFAFASMMLLLLLARWLDKTLSTNTIILIGVIFSMFATSLISLVTAFAGEKVKTITFWTMGSLAGSGYTQVLLLLCAFALCGGVIFCCAQELNALSLGEENALHIGVDVKRVKLLLMAAVSVLLGVSVSVGGSIGFVGLVMPHITRMLTGPNHRRLLPGTAFLGAVFLLLADLLARTIVSPRELPVGVVTSLVGAVVFVVIFYRTRKGR